jgi:triosephosphate isomerase (TIM)
MHYLIANWKMNLPPEGLSEYMLRLHDADPHTARIVVAPPFPYIRDVVAHAGGHVVVGAQNCGDQKSGAFTGEVSASMLRECGAQYVIVGHSERRNVYGESDALIARRLAMAVEHGLTAVLCIGEDLRVREAGHVTRFLADQIKAVVSPAIGSGDIIIAYEPVWAIGTGRSATGATCAETVASIRDAVVRFWPPRHASAAILYGGSVTPENIADLWTNGGIDGFLVGGASLDSSKFLAIYEQMRPA